MTASTDTDPAVEERGHGARPGRRAHSRTPLGGGNRIGAGHLVGGRPAPYRPAEGLPLAAARAVAPDVSGAGRGR